MFEVIYMGEMGRSFQGSYNCDLKICLKNPLTLCSQHREINLYHLTYQRNTEEGDNYRDH